MEFSGAPSGSYPYAPKARAPASIGPARDGRVSSMPRTRASGGGSLGTEACGTESQPDPVALVVRYRGEGRPDVGGGNASEDGQRLLHAVVHVREGRRIENIDERGEALVHAMGEGEIPRPHRGEELRLEVGGHAAHARDAAVGAEKKACHERHGERGEHG